jgi:hypothetical protein
VVLLQNILNVDTRLYRSRASKLTLLLILAVAPVPETAPIPWEAFSNYGLMKSECHHYLTVFSQQL